MARLHFWEDPSVIQQNKLDGHNLALPFDEDDPLLSYTQMSA